MECLNPMKKFLKMKMSAGAANIQSFLIAQLEQCDCTAVWEKNSEIVDSAQLEQEDVLFLIDLVWFFYLMLCTPGTVHCTVQCAQLEQCTAVHIVE